MSPGDRPHALSRRGAARALVAALAAPAFGCSSSRRLPLEKEPPAGASASASAAAPEAPAPPPAGVRTVEVPGDLPAFFLRGKAGAGGLMVFLHGACCHALGYVQAFQGAAAERASVLGLQGDRSCGGAFRSWTLDAARQQARVAAALRAAGEGEPRDAIVIGYSQGALLAEQFSARFPAAYSRAILIGAPRVPSAANFGRARGVVMMAGQFDARQIMKDGARALAARGVPSTYVEIPGARHGQMGDGDRFMGEAFAWLEAHAKPAG